MKTVYIAGPLFTEAEMTQRKHEGALIRDALEASGHEWEVFNPIESPVNFKEMEPTSALIFKTDYDFMYRTNHYFFDLSNHDTGTFVELGMALEMFRKAKEAEEGYPIHIYPVFSDIRIPAAGQYDGIHVPTGNNQFVVGALEYYGIEIFSTFSDALNQFKHDLHKAQ